MKYVSCVALFTLLGCSPAANTVSTTATLDQPIPLTTQSAIEMIFLPGGKFTMGGSGGEPDELPTHAVTVSPFAIDRTEVTHAMLTKAELPNPSKWQDSPEGPVNQIRWRDAKVYCNERSLAEGLEPCYDEQAAGMPCDFAKNGYRLPTEAEWEYAATCGGQGGPADSKLAASAWFADNSGSQTHPVASRRPNSWGIHGMYGNVSEWCQDVYQADYYATSPAVDPTGPLNATPDAKRAVRGGSWKATASMCRSEFRQGKTTGDSDACFTSDDCGFRCIRRMSKDEATSLTTPK